jgi:hypothetical protein
MVRFLGGRSQRPPQSLDHAVVDPAAFAIHRYLHLGLLELINPVAAGELRSLIGVEDLRRAVFGQGLFQKSASKVFDNRQASTLRLCQSMMATRYKKPRSIRI